MIVALDPVAGSSITLPTKKSSALSTVSAKLTSSQRETTPSESPDITVFPTWKLLDTKSKLNIGKYFSGVKVIEELTVSSFPIESVSLSLLNL